MRLGSGGSYSSIRYKVRVNATQKSLPRTLSRGFRNKVHDDPSSSLARPIRNGLGLYCMYPRPGFHVLCQEVLLVLESLD